MEEIFKSFCAFGSGNTPNKTNNNNNASGGCTPSKSPARPSTASTPVKTVRPTMGNAKLAKFSRDMKLLDKRLTSTDVDLIFTKVKKKNEQKITYAEFTKALHLMAAKKYPEEEEGDIGGKAYAKLERHVLEQGAEGGRPKTTKTTRQVRTDVVDRLTDVTKYTGSHKERFDVSGKGKGLSGRYEVINGDGYTQGYKNMNTYGQTHRP